MRRLAQSNKNAAKDPPRRRSDFGIDRINRAGAEPTSRPSDAALRQKIADLDARIDRLQTQSAARQTAVMNQIQDDADAHSKFISDVPFSAGTTRMSVSSSKATTEISPPTPAS